MTVQLTYQPLAVSSFGPSNMEIFYVDSDKAVYHKPWNGGSWQTDWDNFHSTYKNPPPAALSYTTGVWDLFAIGAGGSDAADWKKDWQSLGGHSTLISNVSALVATRSAIYVFVVLYDGAMYYLVGDGNVWNPQFKSLGGRFISAPASVSWVEGRIDVFGIGTDFAVWHNSNDGRQWQSDWDSIGGSCTTPPMVVSRDTKLLDVICVGTDDTVNWNAFDGSRWFSEWKSLGSGVTKSGPPAGSSGNNDSPSDINPMTSATWDNGGGGGMPTARPV
ncbi:MAG: hypothetical protein Q9218_005061 [Villophora microphyllina]